jgi:hypothetical protein
MLTPTDRTAGCGGQLMIETLSGWGECVSEKKNTSLMGGVKIHPATLCV